MDQAVTQVRLNCWSLTPLRRGSDNQGTCTDRNVKNRRTRARRRLGYGVHASAKQAWSGTVQGSAAKRCQRGPLQRPCSTSAASSAAQLASKPDLGCSTSAHHAAHDFTTSLDRPPDLSLRASVDASCPLLYLPHLVLFWRLLGTLAGGLQDLPLPRHLAQRQSARTGGRDAQVHNWLVKGHRLRRVRITYFDAGQAGQAFNALLDPDCRFDLPLLGIDLLSFGKKLLCVVDFQPLQQDPAYLARHTGCLQPTWAEYRDLCSRMSTRHFDQAQFFSPYMLFVRSQDRALVQAPGGRIYEALDAYVRIYLAQLAAAEPNGEPAAVEHVWERQVAYEQYNADRDPAIALFKTYFGKEVRACHGFENRVVLSGCT